MEFQDNRPAQGALIEFHSSKVFISIKYTNKRIKSPLYIKIFLCSMDTKWIEPLQLLSLLISQLTIMGSSAELC